MAVPVNTPIPAVVLQWVRDMGPLHLFIGRLRPGWNELSVTNAQGGKVDAHVSQSFRDGIRKLTIELDVHPEPDPRQLTLSGLLALPSPSGVVMQCEHPTALNAQCESKSRPLCRVHMRDDTEVVLCSYHAHRAVRHKHAVRFERIASAAGNHEKHA